MKRIVLRVWLVWEKLFAAMFRIRPVDPDHSEKSILKLRARKYMGGIDIPLRDGIVIRRGDRIAELHLDNEVLALIGAESKSTVHLTIKFIRRVEAQLPAVARILRDDPEYRDAVGVYGISLINRGVEPFGFTTADMPKGLMYRMTLIYLRILMIVIHPQGRKRLGVRRDQLVPKIVAISRQDLIERYGNHNHAG